MYLNSQNGNESALVGLVTRAIPRADNRWSGGNRSGWSNPEFDRLSAAYLNAVEPTDRVRSLAEMSRLFTDDLPAIPIQFDLITMAHAPNLIGLRNVAQEAAVAWNLEDWDLR